MRRFSSRQVQASEGIAEVVREKDVVVHGGPDDSEDENNADIGRPPTKRREAASLPPPAHLTYLPDDDIVDMSDDEFG